MQVKIIYSYNQYNLYVCMCVYLQIFIKKIIYCKIIGKFCMYINYMLYDCAVKAEIKTYFK